jgi:hypothetical protein
MTTTWWLDSSALPEQIWARLRVAHDGSAEVLDCDGSLHQFSDASEAEHWLREDEYSRLSELLEDGEVPQDTAVPQGTDETDLIRHMLRPDPS